MVTKKYQIDIDMEYADGIDKLTSIHSSIKFHIPEALESRDLMINQEKTEQYLKNTSSL